MSQIYSSLRTDGQIDGRTNERTDGSVRYLKCSTVHAASIRFPVNVKGL